MGSLFIQILILMCVFLYCVSESENNESENKILKFRADLDQIGVDFENFFYDILSEAVKSYEKITKPYSIPKFEFKPNLNNVNAIKDLSHLLATTLAPVNLKGLETTTLRSKNVLDNYLSNYIDKKLPPFITNRLKRAIESNKLQPTCSQKTLEDRHLEQMHLDGLKQEIEKLKDLVLLLRSQQKTITSLDELQGKNNQTTKDQIKSNWSNSPVSFEKVKDMSRNPVHKELANLKNDLQETISLLNLTRTFLVQEQQEGVSLKKEMKILNRELIEMRMVIEKLNELNNKSASSNLDHQSGEILGGSMHLPKPLPINKIPKPKNKIAVIRNRNEEVNREAKSSGLDKLLRELDRPNDLSTQLSKLQEELKRNKDQEKLRTLLQGLVKNQDKSEQNLLSDNSDNNSQLQKLLNAIDKPQSKIDNNDVETNLKHLEDAINSVQSHSLNTNNIKDFQTDDLIKLLLVDILNRHDDRQKQIPDSLPSSVASLTPQQIRDLRKRLEQIANNGNKPQSSHFPMPETYGNIPFPPYLPSNDLYGTNYGMYLPPYPYPFNYGGNPSQISADGQYGNTVPNKQYAATPPSDIPQFPSPYGDMFPTNGAPTGGVTNQFFPNPKPVQYEKYDSNYILPPENFIGGNSVQPGTYPQANSYMEDYKTKSVQQLKNEIGDLQHYIGDVKNPGYAKNSNNQDVIPKLENQLNELQAIITSMDQDVPLQPPTDTKAPPLPFNPNYGVDTRLKRSLNTNDETSVNLYDEVATKLKEYLFSSPKISKERSAYNNVQQGIYGVMSQLGNYENAYLPMPYQPYHLPSYLDFKSKTGGGILESKGSNLVASILEKIIDGLIKALPSIIEKLFGKGFHELFNFNNDYKYSSNYQSMYDSKRDIQNLFKNLGFVGYLPMVILKIIDGFTTFMNILKKNSFFKTFLLPVLILLVITGSVILLIWWFQPDVKQDSDVYKTYSNYYSPQQSPVNTNTYQGNSDVRLYNKYAYYNKNRKFHSPSGYSHSYYDY